MSETQLKAISLHQPVAQLVRLGRKGYETRSFNTKHRGILLIHAAKTRKGFKLYESGGLDETECAFGALICAVNLVETFRTEDIAPMLSKEELSYGDFSPSRWAWQLQGRILFDPIPYKGQQGFFKVNRDIIVDIPGSKS